MTFTIRNRAQIANKYLRFAQWKIRKLSSRFLDVLYTEIYVKKVASRPDVFAVTIKLGVPGPDVVVSAKSDNLNELFSVLSVKLKRKLRKASSKGKLGYSD